MTVEDRLRDAQPPDSEAARERARRVVLASAPPPRSRRRRLPLAVLALAATAVVALTPPGEALARWLEDLVTVGASVPPPATRLGPLPGDGELLATGADGAWRIDAGGERHRLGTFSAAEWSPRGLFVAVARADHLRAIEPDGDLRWDIATPGVVADPRWSSEGYRIAYRADADLRVVAGDGTGDHALVDAVAPVPAAWRQGPGHEVAVARADGALELWAADAGGRLWRRPATSTVLIGWTPADRLIAVTDAGVLVLDGDGRTVRRVPLPPGIDHAALSPDGMRLALARGREVSTLRIARPVGLRTRLKAPEPVSGLAWAPSGRHVVAASPGEWSFIAVPDGRVTVARAPGLAHLGGWCCVEDEPVDAPAFAAADDLHLRTVRTYSAGCTAYVSTASTAPLLDARNQFPPGDSARALGPAGTLVVVTAVRDEGNCTRLIGPRELDLAGVVRGGWPGMLDSDPFLLTVRGRRENYSVEVRAFARDSAGEARAAGLVGTLRFPDRLR